MNSFAFAINSEEFGCIHINWIYQIQSYLESYRQHIVIIFLFIAVNLLVFFERFWRKFSIKLYFLLYFFLI